MRKKTVPQGWIRIKLGEYLEELSERHNVSSNSDIPVLSVTNRPGFTMSEEFFDKKVFSKDLRNYKVVHRGQFAYNPSRVNVGSIARLKEFNKGLLSPMYVAFEAKEGLDGSYLDYWISSQRFRNLVKASTQGSVRDSLNFSALAEFPFALPSKIQQREIVSILSCVDSVIDKTQAIIDQTQTLKKGLMQELFTRGIPGRHKKFKKTEIGEVPEGWEIKTVKELISLCQYGLSRALSLGPQGVPILRMNNLNAGEVSFDDVKYLVLTDDEERDYILNSMDLLFNRTNSRKLVGKVAIFHGGTKTSFASYLLRIRVKKDITDPRWLNYYFNREDIQEKLRHLATPGVSQSNINAKVMQNLKFCVPSLKEQQEIADLIDLLNGRLRKDALVKESFVQLKSALMQVLLSGEVRVKV